MAVAEAVDRSSVDRRSRRRRHRRPGEHRRREPGHGPGDRPRPRPGRRRGPPTGRARRAPRSPAGRRSASRAAAASCGARRSGSSTTASASSRRSSPRPARPTRTRCIAEIIYGGRAFGFWAKNAEKFLADEKVKSASPLRQGQEARRRATSRSALVGVIGPWNYPLTNSFGDCIPALAAGNAVILKPSRGHAADGAADGRGAARVRPARRRLPGRHRRAARPARRSIDEVDMIMFTGSTRTGKKVMASGRRDADAGRRSSSAARTR